MSTYKPDKWVIVEVKRPNHETVYKVFASWGGGYLDGPSWKMNSGITKVVDNGDSYDVHGYSGSVYSLRNGGYGMTGYGSGAYLNLEKQVTEHGEGYSITIFPEDQVDEFLRNFKSTDT